MAGLAGEFCPASASWGLLLEPGQSARRARVRLRMPSSVGIAPIGAANLVRRLDGRTSIAVSRPNLFNVVAPAEQPVKLFFMTPRVSTRNARRSRFTDSRTDRADSQAAVSHQADGAAGEGVLRVRCCIDGELVQGGNHSSPPIARRVLGGTSALIRFGIMAMFSANVVIIAPRDESLPR